MAKRLSRLNDNKILQLVGNSIKNNSDILVDQLMGRFNKEIVIHEDPEDPARPSVCADEFRLFLKETIEKNIKISVSNAEITISLSDDKKLGLEQDLDEDTTDCIKIIGTILQGIVGDYVLVTSDMTGGPEGRFGKAFLLPERLYRIEAKEKGWDINRPIWQFSNFAGVPDFFNNIDFSKLMEIIVKDISGALSR